MLLTVLVSFSLFLPHHSIATVQVKTEQGTLEGVISHSRDGFEFFSFFGIPYAKPPVGDLRFEPPKDADHWEGIRDAKTPPPACIQSNAFSFPPTPVRKISGEEDCLYLNVYTANVTESVPVIVYIHGGAFQSGNSFMAGPEYFMDHAVVVVTVQYRLTILGFLSAADEILPGNYGMKDQAAALKWVQKNIAVFGGDPKRVTLAGESAGAASVHLHVHSPYSTGLFHQAMVLSGSSLATWSVIKSETARDRAHALGVLIGCPNLETKALVRCLRRVSAKKIVEAHNKFFVYELVPPISFAPVVESKNVPDAFLIRNPWDQNPVNNVPMICGVTTDEGGVLASRIRSIPSELELWNRQYDELLSISLSYANETNSSAISAAIRKFYFGNDSIDASTGEKLSKMFMDGVIMTHVVEAARRHNNRVFFYWYDHRNNNSFNDVFGNLTKDRSVCHGDDLFSMFSLRGSFPPVTEGSDLAVSRRFIRYCVNFMKTGDPNGDIKIWQPFRENFEYLHITTDSDKMEEKLFHDRYNFWMDLHLHPRKLN